MSHVNGPIESRMLELDCQRLGIGAVEISESRGVHLQINLSRVNNGFKWYVN